MQLCQLATTAPPLLSTWEWIGVIGMLGAVALWMNKAYARLASMDALLSQVRNDLRQHQADYKHLLQLLCDHERRLSVAENEIERWRE